MILLFFLMNNSLFNIKVTLSAWILIAQKTNIHAFVNCSFAMINWSSGILNSFDFPFTNGFTEGS